MSDKSFQIIEDTLIATIPLNTTNKGLSDFRTHLLNSVYSAEVEFVIFDFSDVKHIDRFEIKHLMETKQMLLIIGIQIIFSGLNPGVVSTLIHLNFDPDTIKASLNLAKALQMKNELKKNESNDFLTDGEDHLEIENQIPIYEDDEEIDVEEESNSEIYIDESLDEEETLHEEMDEADDEENEVDKNVSDESEENEKGNNIPEQ